MKGSLVVRFPLLLFLGVLPSLLSGPDLTTPPSDAGRGQSERKVEQWIKNLGSDSFEQREAAERALMNLEDEPPGLRKALESPDLEVRRSVAGILETFAAKRAQRGLKRVQALAKEGRVDEMVERLVLWRERIQEEEEWRAVAELAAGLVEWQHRTYGNAHFLTQEFSSHVPPVFRGKNFSLKDKITSKELARMWTRSRHILGQEVVLDVKNISREHLVVLASGNVCTPTLDGSILLANGSIRIQDGLTNSIIFCEEDLEVSGGIHNSLVIVRGKVACHKKSNIADSTILSGCPIAFSEGAKVENAAIVSGDSIVCPKHLTLGRRALITTSIPDWPVKFFDPEFAGLSVWQVYRNNGMLRNEPPLLALADGVEFAGGVEANPDIGAGVQIKKVHKGSPFAGGLHESEIVTAIDKQKTPSKESFRKVLRRKLAEGGPILTFTVRRTDKILEEIWDGNGWLLKHSGKAGRLDQTVEVPIRVKD
jgi:hypothetical protein